MGGGSRIPWVRIDKVIDLFPPRFPVYALASWPAERTVYPCWISDDVIEEIYVRHNGRSDEGEVTVYSGTVADRIGGDDEEMFAQGLWAHPDLESSEVALTIGAWPEWKDLALTMHREPIRLLIDGEDVDGEGVISESRWFAQVRFPDHQIRVSAHLVKPSDIHLVLVEGVTSEVHTNRWGQLHARMSIIH